MVLTAKQGRCDRDCQERGRRAPCSRRATSGPQRQRGTISAQAACCWVGEAMRKTDFKDLPKIPDDMQGLAGILSANAVHAANLLKAQPYPGMPKQK